METSRKAAKIAEPSEILRYPDLHERPSVYAPGRSLSIGGNALPRARARVFPGTSYADSGGKGIASISDAWRRRVAMELMTYATTAYLS